MVTTPRATLIPAHGNGRRLLQRPPQIQEQVAAVIRANAASDSHTNGVLVAELERRFKKRVGAGAAFGLNCGSSALRAACEVLRLPPGSEVIMPAYTFIMTAYAVSDAFALSAHDGTLSKVGLVPVFVDIDPQTYTLDPLRVQAAITDKTAAIMAVHLFGQMAEMRALLDLAEKHGLFLIEDAAQAYGASVLDALTENTWSAGSVGHFGCFSLSAVKQVGSMGADAGMLTVAQRLIDDTPDIIERVRGWRNTGRLSAHRYLHQAWGIRARMDEYSAAECLAELDLAEQWHRRRAAIAARYSAALEHSSRGVQAPFVAPGRQHAYFHYMVQALTTQARRELERRLIAAGIAVGDSYTVVADQDLYATGKLPCRVEGVDVARKVSHLLVPIPCYPELSEAEIERIEAVLAS